MKPSVKENRKTHVFSKRDYKKSINLPWNSRLFFQIGLIVSLLGVFFVMQSTIGSVTYEAKESKETLLEPYMITIIPEVPTPEKPIVKNDEPKKLVASKKLSNNYVTKVDPPTSLKAPVEPGDPDPVKGKESLVNTPEMPKIDTSPKNINSVEYVPVYPGCEALATNKEKIACMSSKINEFINRKFRTDKFTDLKPNEIQKIFVQFKIDATGNVTDISAKSNIKSLEKEGERVISQLPKMIPGKQGKTKVDVIYMVPISFKVLN